MDPIDKLCWVGGVELGRNPNPTIPEDLLGVAGKLGPELADMLKLKNGFFAFETALHVFSVETTEWGYGLVDWNSAKLWRSEYDGMADGFLFFAEDIYGEQFGIRDNKVYRFNPENGWTKKVSEKLADWAEIILTNYDFETGYSLAHDWQTANGALERGRRLLPRLPFVLGGAYSLENLCEHEPAEGMRWRASLAVQARNWTPGTKVRPKFEM